MSLGAIPDASMASYVSNLLFMGMPQLKHSSGIRRSVVASVLHVDITVFAIHFLAQKGRDALLQVLTSKEN